MSPTRREAGVHRTSGSTAAPFVIEDSGVGLAAAEDDDCMRRTLDTDDGEILAQAMRAVRDRTLLDARGRGTTKRIMIVAISH